VTTELQERQAARLQRVISRHQKNTQFIRRALLYVEEINSVAKLYPSDPTMHRLQRAAESLRHNLGLALTPLSTATRERSADEAATT
jgi:hypothetical protein